MFFAVENGAGLVRLLRLGLPKKQPRE